LTEVKETTVRVAKDVKVFTPKDEKRITGGELVENPAGLKAIQYMRADPRSSSTYHYAQITIDEKTESVTAIRMIGTFWIERRMKPE
jgi:hypothetical protein